MCVSKQHLEEEILGLRLFLSLGEIKGEGQILGMLAMMIYLKRTCDNAIISLFFLAEMESISLLFWEALQ